MSSKAPGQGGSTLGQPARPPLLGPLPGCQEQGHWGPTLHHLPSHRVPKQLVSRSEWALGCGWPVLRFPQLCRPCWTCDRSSGRRGHLCGNLAAGAALVAVGLVEEWHFFLTWGHLGCWWPGGDQYCRLVCPWLGGRFTFLRFWLCPLPTSLSWAWLFLCCQAGCYGGLRSARA